MPDPNDPPRPPDPPGSGGELFPGLRRRRRSPGAPGGPPWGMILLVLVVVAALAGAGWYWLRGTGEPGPVAEGPPSGFPTVQPPQEEEAEPLDLPPVEESDDFIRELASRLSAHPQLAAWLATDALVHRFVDTVVAIAGGRSPADRLPFLVPEEEFRVQGAEGALAVDPASYRRYDLLAETFVSIDTEDAARLYRGLHPLFEEAYLELGLTESSFDEMLARAIRNLRAVRVPDDPPGVVQNEAVYDYREAALEDRTPAEKHILRLGPGNALAVQEKLGDLATALELPPAP